MLEQELEQLQKENESLSQLISGQNSGMESLRIDCDKLRD